GKVSRLKSRRNKNHVSGAFIPKTYINSKDGIEVVEKIITQISSLELQEDYERIILAEYALKLLASRHGLANDWCMLRDFINKSTLVDKRHLDCYSVLIEDLLAGVDQIEGKIHILEPALNNPISYIEEQDFLGLLSMSLQNIGERKAKGIYYTPITVVQDAVDNLDFTDIKKILDPCCGTGNFLIYAYKYLQNLEGIYGFDISPLSVSLTRINMALVSKTKDIDILYKNFTCKDTLLNKVKEEFDLIIGNPPWGYNYTSEEEKVLKRTYFSAQAKTVESFCVFTEYALKSIKPKGLVTLILPQSFLNVKIHQPIRDYLMENSKLKRIRYWENIFDGVQCPAMTLSFKKEENNLQEKIKAISDFLVEELEVVTDERSFVIKNPRTVEKDNWYFDVTDEEVQLLEKIERVKSTTLKGQGDFALGIVTGDNKRFITEEKTPGSEIILRGSDVFKYKFLPPERYIKFEPEKFQQVAPTALYRAKEKLLYRFICDSLVFAYDDKQTLSLNSANIVIPQIEGMDIKYILAVLNSRMIQYYFNHRFKSVKILRSHIESLPIPYLEDKKQEKIIKKVDKILGTDQPEEIIELYESIDMDIKEVFGLSDFDYEVIKKSLSKPNPFLTGK
ncbi:MAG: N-6 DNA methylase, partial [Desulfitobacterium sp.]|nr:N-6 DNA methylase [Desulfitobacterium sp.]